MPVKKKKIEATLPIPFIEREVEHKLIHQRIADGYINATALCKASGKLIGHYFELASTKAFLTELSTDIGIPISALTQVVKGGLPEYQGTWVHPQVAIHLGQWASPKFAVLVSKWVFEWMTGKVSGSAALPYHLRRYLLNRTNIPAGYFSVFSELAITLIAPLEDMGYHLPDKMIPDISQGKMFAGWVRKEKGLEPNDFPTCKHEYPDGRIIPNVKLYPNSLLGDFRDHFNNVWLHERALPYFEERDIKALPHLRKLILSLPPVEKKREIEEAKYVEIEEDDFDKAIVKAITFKSKTKKS